MITKFFNLNNYLSKEKKMTTISDNMSDLEKPFRYYPKVMHEDLYFALRAEVDFQ